MKANYISHAFPTGWVGGLAQTVTVNASGYVNMSPTTISFCRVEDVGAMGVFLKKIHKFIIIVISTF